jgi:hypothetical protein
MTSVTPLNELQAWQMQEVLALPCPGPGWINLTACGPKPIAAYVDFHDKMLEVRSSLPGPSPPYLQHLVVAIMPLPVPFHMTLPMSSVAALNGMKAGKWDADGKHWSLTINSCHPPIHPSPNDIVSTS